MNQFINISQEMKETIIELLKNTYTKLDETYQIKLISHQTQGFVIKKLENRIDIFYHSKSDLCAAIGYLITHQHQKTYEITQHRIFKNLGLMLDVARNAVLKIETIQDYIRILALLGFNYLELYVEDVMEVIDEPLFGYMRGKYKIEDFKKLDDYAALFGIELVPCIQTLAHLEGIFKHPVYRKINDIDDILLVGHNQTYELIENMLKTTRQAFKSNRINIGMDEAWKLGLGKYLSQNGFQNRFEIMKKHLDTVLDLCRKYNYKPAMWADMFFHLSTGSYHQGSVVFNEEIKNQIPKDIDLIYWDYYQTTYDGYDDKFKSMKQLSENISFAGGAWKWIGFAPHNRFSERSMSKAILAAKDHQIEDFLLTAWGDNGGEASCFSILPTLIYIRELSYNQHMDKVSMNQYATLLTNYDYDELQTLDLPNILYSHHDYKITNPSKYLLFEDVLTGHLMIAPHQNIKTIYEGYKEVFKKLIHRNSHLNYLFKSHYHLVDALSVKSTLSIDLYHAYHHLSKEEIYLQIENIKSAIMLIERYYQVFKKQWMIENKTYGFEIQSYRFGGLKMRLEEVVVMLTSYVEGDIHQIDELEERIISHDLEDLWNQTISFNQFIQMISYNKL
jgi:hypothetical protein